MIRARAILYFLFYLIESRVCTKLTIFFLVYFLITVEEKNNEVTKQTIRKRVWEYLERNGLSSFPRPVYGRIPNFKGCEEAAAKLSEIEEYQNCMTIEVNPDKPQEAARVLALENNKKLYVPVPRLTDGLLKYISVPENSNRASLKQAVSRKGIEECGKTINYEDDIHIDFLVLGSVAVSKDGTYFDYECVLIN